MPFLFLSKPQGDIQMFSNNELNSLDLTVNEKNLYMEESFTDLDMMSIRRLTPVKPNGVKDKHRKPVFIGHLNLMTPKGPLPIQSRIEAASLKEAMKLYPQTMKTVLAKMQKEVEQVRQQQNSRIIVP